MRKISVLAMLCMVISWLPILPVHAGVGDEHAINPSTETVINAYDPTHTTDSSAIEESEYVKLNHLANVSYTLVVPTDGNGTYSVEILAASASDVNSAYVGVYRHGKRYWTDQHQYPAFAPAQFTLMSKGKIGAGAEEGAAALGEKEWYSLGSISLEDGENYIALRCIEDGLSGIAKAVIARSVYATEIRIKRIGEFEDMPIILSAADLDLAKCSPGMAPGINIENSPDTENPGQFKLNPHLPDLYPFVDMYEPAGGRYVTYDVSIKKAGYYRLIDYSDNHQSGTSNGPTRTTTLDGTVISKNIYVARAITPYKLYPTELCTVYLEDGAHEIKLQSSSGFLNYHCFITLEMIAAMDPLDGKKKLLTDSNTAEFSSLIGTGDNPYDMSVGDMVDSNYGNGANTEASLYASGFKYGGWHSYEVYAEKAGKYSLSMKYATTGATDRAVTISVNDVAQCTDISLDTVPGTTQLVREICTIDLPSGLSTIKIDHSPTGGVLGGIYMSGFSLTKAMVDKIMPADCTDITSPAQVVATNKGEILAISSGGKATFTVNAPSTGFYSLTFNASADNIAKSFTITLNQDAPDSFTVIGSPHFSFGAINACGLYLQEGENEITLESQGPGRLDVRYFAIDRASVAFYEGSVVAANEIDALDGDVIADDIIANVNLNGLFKNKQDAKAAFAIYEDGCLIAYVDESTEGADKIQMIIPAETFEAGKTYTGKVFIWNAMQNGVFTEI